MKSDTKDFLTGMIALRDKFYESCTVITDRAEANRDFETLIGLLSILDYVEALEKIIMKARKELYGDGALSTEDIKALMHHRVQI